jgi:VanZ family protein
LAQGTRLGFLRYWLPVIAYVGLIFSASSVSGLKPPFQFVNSDKLVHIGEYSVLGFLLTRALRTIPRLRGLLAAGLTTLAIGMTIGGLDEIYQRNTPNRESSGLDFVADTLGLSLAVISYAWVHRPREGASRTWQA